MAARLPQPIIIRVRMQPQLTARGHLLAKPGCGRIEFAVTPTPLAGLGSCLHDRGHAETSDTMSTQRLTNSQVAEFQQRGFVLLRGLLDREECDLLLNSLVNDPAVQTG